MNSVREGASDSSVERYGQPDDNEPGIYSTHRFDQHLHAFLLDQLPEVNDERPEPVEKRGKALRVAVVGQALVAAVRWILAGLCEQVLERCATVLQNEPVDVHAGRNVEHAVSVASHDCEHCANVLGANVGRVGARKNSLAHSPNSGRPRIEYSSSEPCALTRKGAPLAAPTGPPISTWLVNTRSAGSNARTAAAFASTYARRSASLKSWRNFGSSPSYRSMTNTGSSRPGRSTAAACAPARS